MSSVVGSVNGGVSDRPQTLAILCRRGGSWSSDIEKGSYAAPSG
jgi:hypothetical protein